MTNRVIKVVTTLGYLNGHERVNDIPGDSEGKGIRSSQASIESSDYVSKSSKKSTKSKMRILVVKLETGSPIIVIDHHAI